MSFELTVAEDRRLKECERTIEQTKGAFVACGNALTAIRDEKLYRKDHKTFDEYCKARWGYTRQRAYQLIEAAAVVKSLPKKLSTQVDKAKQASALAKVPKEKRAKVLRDSIASGDTSPKGIKAAAEESKKDEAQKDHTNYPIPESILEDWTLAEETGKRLLRVLSDVRTEIREGIEEEKLIYREIMKNVLADLNNAYSGLKSLVPYAVCTTCQGRVRAKCDLCKGRGFISQFAYHQYVPEEIKIMREKLTA